MGVAYSQPQASQLAALTLRAAVALVAPWWEQLRGVWAVAASTAKERQQQVQGAVGCPAAGSIPS